jgi:hypothetical protein
MYSASAAYGYSAAIFRTRYSELVSQHPEQRHVIFDIYLERFLVDLQKHEYLRTLGELLMLRSTISKYMARPPEAALSILEDIPGSRAKSAIPRPIC